MEDQRPVESAKGRTPAETIEDENSEREPLQPPRKRGRPRIEASKDAKLSKVRMLCLDALVIDLIYCSK